MVQIRLEDLLNSAKGKVINSINVTIGYADMVHFRLSDDFNLMFMYNQRAIKGAYFVDSDLATFYTAGNTTIQPDVVQNLKNFVKKEYGDKKQSTLELMTKDNLHDIIKTKFLEHGCKNMILRTGLTKDYRYDILGMQTERSGLVFGIQYLEKKISYNMGRGKNTKRGELY